MSLPSWVPVSGRQTITEIPTAGGIAGTEGWADPGQPKTRPTTRQPIANNPVGGGKAVGAGCQRGGNGGVEPPGFGDTTVDAAQPAVAGVELSVWEHLEVAALGPGCGVTRTRPRPTWSFCCFVTRASRSANLSSSTLRMVWLYGDPWDSPVPGTPGNACEDLMGESTSPVSQKRFDPFLTSCTRKCDSRSVFSTGGKKDSLSFAVFSLHFLTGMKRRKR